MAQNSTHAPPVKPGERCKPNQGFGLLPVNTILLFEFSPLKL